MMKDLRKIYQEKLLHLGALQDFVQGVNVTRLKEAILEQVRGLCEQKSGRCVLVTVDGDIGKATFEASLSSSHDEGLITCKAAKLIRKYLFSNDERFDGDVSEERHRSSVPNHLVHIIGLILEGTTEYDKISNITESVAINIAQLILLMQ